MTEINGEDKKILEDKSVLLEKGRRGALRIIFGRTTLIVLMFLIQVLLLLGVVEAFENGRSL